MIATRWLHVRTGSGSGADSDDWLAWAGGAGSEPPSRRLAVLAAHGVESTEFWLDRIGSRAAVAWGQWRFSTRLVMQQARAVQNQAEEWRSLDAAALQQRLRLLAEACRLAGSPHSQVAASTTEVAALAGVVVAVERTMHLVPHPEQIAGALGLMAGRMVEMATGEGKTLTAAMAAVVAAWRGLPCHVVTANDYLAKRDAALCQPLFALCGVSAASVDGESPPHVRHAAYGHEIVYATARELLGDYLRDRLLLGTHPSSTRLSLAMARNAAREDAAGVVMRGMYQVIVDEADSVLIDEAVTPLIISSTHPDGWLEEAAYDAVRLAGELECDVGYRVQRALRHVTLTSAGRVWLEERTGELAPFWRHRDRAQELVEMALYAREFLLRDQQFVVEEERVVLVDELTGRLARQHTLSLGMQQILEASQGLPVSPPSKVESRLSFQRFFRLFLRMGGMTGTAREARGEFARVYRLMTMTVPTHRPVQRTMWPLRVFGQREEKIAAIADSALEVAARGRAVLIGMRSVRSSEEVQSRLTVVDPKIKVHLLHAVHHAQESAIVARAGQPGAITIATNMAGRGTDIVLHPEVRARGGLHVIIGEPNDFGRIDRQLIGRCARQGDPGSVQRFVACDEELMRRFLPRWVRYLWAWQQQVVPVMDRVVTGFLLDQAQARAERLACRQRQTIVKMDIELDRSGF
ncbi:MAG: preprotein translocase subunit SecA [Magnetococcales bacterium]|nr:preprotein translocase subunit SecA [Magnetococcales bacterium]